MTTTATNISVVLSGGSNNFDPDSSLGGSPSVTPLTNSVLNNLFSDVTSDDSLEGVEDYRCIYFFNDGDTTIFSVKLWIYEDFVDGATIEVGVASQDENQRILLQGVPTGGSATFSYDGNNVVVNYDSELSNMALELQDSLNALMDGDQPLLQDVVVTAQPVGPNIYFDILFADRDGKKDHPTITVVSNDFTPSLSISISTTQAGFPVNTIAPEIGNSTIPPGGVGFFAASEISPVSIPKLTVGDGFPLWIKRVVVASTDAKANDGVKLRFEAESLGG